MFLNSLHAVLLQSILLVGFFPLPAPTAPSSPLQQRASGTFSRREANVYAPTLYANDIDFTATLVDLPGAKKRRSYWQLSYSLYFIPESNYYQALEQMAPGTSNPGPEQFSGKVLLAQGNEKRVGLSTLKERTLTLRSRPFKSKVADSQRTKFARVLTAYSVKIFDAALNTTVYRSGIFLNKPYEDDPLDGSRIVPRQVIYLNFMVSPQGELNRSQTSRKPGDTGWR